MARMSRNNSASSLAGFSVFQPAIGAQLQFLPALGTQELDTLVDAFLPGPASLKDKRATICMDFCEYARQTGEMMKFYPVFTAPAASAIDSPASSMYDSGYSTYNASPVVSDMSVWTQPASFSAPSPASQSRTKSRKASAASAKAQTGDFSHLPGMKIMTREGVDVTNSASRGCKTKEQRDHAHLMRIIKACDACKRKKIRCDPSHKKRSASQAQSSSPEPKPGKKTKKERPSPERQSDPPVIPTSDFLFSSAPFDFDFELNPDVQHYAHDTLEESWEQFVKYDDEPAAVIPPEYDFFFDSGDFFSSPSSGSSASPAQPFTPAATVTSYSDAYSGALFPEPDDQEATLPYLNPSCLHGTNYIDFNLYSPSPSFLDEELQQQVQTTKAGLPDSGPTRKRQRSAGSRHDNQGHANSEAFANGLQSLPTATQEESYSCGCTEDNSPQKSQTIGVSDPAWSVPGDPRPSPSPPSSQQSSQAYGGQAQVPWFSLSQSTPALNAPLQTSLSSQRCQSTSHSIATATAAAITTTAASSALEGLRDRLNVDEQLRCPGQDGLPGDSVSSLMGALLAVTLMLSIPIRQFVDVSRRDLWSLGCVVVGLGLVSLFSMYLLQSRSAGDAANSASKLSTIALSVAPLAIRHHTKKSASSSSTQTDHSVVSRLVDSAKLKMRSVSQTVDNLRCLISRRLTTPRRRARPSRTLRS